MGNDTERVTFTDPIKWMTALGFAEHGDFWDLYAVYHTFADCDSGYGYDFEREGETIVVRPYDDAYPILKTDVAGAAALTMYLDKLYEEIGGIDAYDSFLRAMEKDD